MVAAGVGGVASAELQEADRAHFRDALLWSADGGWALAGRLEAVRDGHRAARIGERVLLVGGNEDRATTATVWSPGRITEEPMPRVPDHLGLVLGGDDGSAVALGGWADDETR